MFLLVVGWCVARGWLATALWRSLGVGLEDDYMPTGKTFVQELALDMGILDGRSDLVPAIPAAIVAVLLVDFVIKRVGRAHEQA